MRCQASYDILPVKSFAQYIVQDQDGRPDISGKHCIRQPEIIFVIQDVQVIDNSLIGNIPICKTDYLVEDGQRVAHTTIRFLGNHIQGFRFSRHSFAGRYVFQMLHHIGNRDTRKVVYLATGQDGRQHLMLLRRSQNEQSMMGRFLQCFQKCIESRRTQHMHLIDNKDLVFSDRRRNAHLVDQGTDVIDRVVGGGIEFMDIIRTLLVEGLAGFAFVTGFPVGSRIQTIDRLGKDTGTRSLAHSTGTAKEVGMSQLVTLYCILKCSCQGLLSYHTTKSRRTVFPCRYNIIIHSLLFY